MTCKKGVNKMPLERRSELNKTLNPRYIYRDESRSIRDLLRLEPRLIVTMHNDFYEWHQELKASHKMIELQEFGINTSNLRITMTKYNMENNDKNEPLYSGIMDFSGVIECLDQPINKAIDKIMVCFFMTAFNSSAYSRKLLFNETLEAHIRNKELHETTLRYYQKYGF